MSMPMTRSIRSGRSIAYWYPKKQPQSWSKRTMGRFRLTTSTTLSTRVSISRSEVARRLEPGSKPGRGEAHAPERVAQGGHPSVPEHARVRPAVQHEDHRTAFAVSEDLQAVNVRSLRSN